MKLLSVFSGLGRRAAPAAGGWFRREEAMMATAIVAELWAESAAEAEAALDAVMDEMRRIERTMSPFRESSELSRVNREAGHQAVPVSAELLELVTRAVGFSALSQGAFDISFAAAGRLYDYRLGVMPDAAALRQARQAIDWRAILLDRAAGTIRFGRPGMRLDLGGIAKGHAVDRCIALLQARGIRHAMVAAGGDSRVLGDRRGRPWTVAVRDPRQAQEVVAVLPLRDVSISTSGDYERYFERDGVRHHHLIDPRTGASPRDIHSVTVLADDGVTAEALSKTVFVLGVAAGLPIVERVPGADVVVIDAQGQMHRSSGLTDPRH